MCPSNASPRCFRLPLRKHPSVAAVSVVSCSLVGGQPCSSGRSWYGWASTSPKYYSTICHVSRRMRTTEKWQEANYPPVGKVECAVCRATAGRMQTLVPIAVPQPLSKSAPTSIMSMLRKVGLATLGQQYGHDEPCRLRASDKHLQRLRQVASCQAAPSLPKSSSSLVGRPVLGRRGLAMRRCRWRWTGRGPL